MTDGSTDQDVISSGTKLFVAEATRSGLIFFGIVFFARTLTASEIGTFFLFQAVLFTLSVVTDFGINSALEKRISEGQTAENVLATAISLKLIPLSATVAAVLLFQGLVNDYLGLDIAVQLAIALVVLEAANATIHTLKGELRVGETATLQLVHGIVWLLFSGVFVHFGYGARALIYALIISYSGIVILGVYKQTTTLGSPSISNGWSLFNYSKYAVISSIGSNVYQWVDVLIIGLLLTSAHVGAYEIAWQITAFVLLFSKSIATATLPHVSRLSTVGTSKQIEELLPNLLTLSILLVIPAFAGTVLLSEEILGLIFGDAYRFAWIVLILLMLEKIIQAPTQVVNEALLGLNRPDLPARAMIVAIPLNIVLNLVLVWYVGLIGAAIATGIAYFVFASMQFYYLSNIITLHVHWREIWWCVGASAVMALVVNFASEYVQITSTFSLSAVILLGGLTYGVLITAYTPVRTKVLVSIRGIMS